MKSYVITLKNHEESNISADRCIESGRLFNLKIEKFWATTPKDNTDLNLIKKYGILDKNFDEVYSNTEVCKCVFLSHYHLWQKCVKINEPILILEHDAVIKGFINMPVLNQNLIINLGKPSYGKFNTPHSIGIQKHFSKRYMGGAHGYYINPIGASNLIEESVFSARPVDVFMNTETFPDLLEMYPWPIECEDYFSTVQNNKGCYAKHNFNPNYKNLEND